MRLGMWRSCSLHAFVQTQHDAIMSGSVGWRIRQHARATLQRMPLALSHCQTKASRHRYAAGPAPATARPTRDEVIRLGWQKRTGAGRARKPNPRGSRQTVNCPRGHARLWKICRGSPPGAALGLTFSDADEEIERAAGKPIVDIFKDHGEVHFRDGERKVIARLLAAGPQVLATGGGAFMTAETRDNIHRRGVSIWLKAELGLLMRRVQKKSNRPLLEGDPEGALRRLLTARNPIYALADITIESRDVPHDAIVGDIIEALRKSLLGDDSPETGTAARLP